MEINIHGAEPRITKEMPTNGLSVTVDWGEGNNSTLYFADVETWYLFRNGFKKAEHYCMITDTDNKDLAEWGEIEAGTDADTWAYAHLKAQRGLKKEKHNGI